MKLFYKYLIYRLYHFTNKKNAAETPLNNVVLTLFIVHSIQLLTLYCICLKIWPALDFILEFNKIVFYSLAILFMGLHYFVFYDRNKIAEYNKLFESENAEQKRRLTSLVILYLIGSIIAFFVTVVFLFEIL